MVFVADDLAAGLIGVLADAGRKKLTRLVLGSDQERALQRAAAAAIEATAAELDPSGGDRAGQLAMVVSEVFRDPAPDARVAGRATLLEAVQAGIAERLAVLDDAAVTGTGQSSGRGAGPAGRRAGRDAAGAPSTHRTWLPWSAPERLSSTETSLNDPARRLSPKPLKILIHRYWQLLVN